MENYKTLRINYGKEFQCIGGDCKLNCCDYNWSIAVDKNTYIKYKKIEKPEYLSNLIKKYISKVESNNKVYKINQKKYNENIILNNYIGGKHKEININFESVTCAFKDKDKLCLIQKELGYDYLCNTCKYYSRLNNFILSNFEYSVNTGCEAVCELLYNIKYGLSFEIIENNIENHINLVYEYDENNKKINYYDNIRFKCIQILQDRSLSLDNRMILISIFMFKIYNLELEEQYENIESYINSFYDNINIYNDIFNNPSINQGIFFDIFNSLIPKGITSHKEVFLVLSNIIFKFEELYNELNSKENRFCKTYLDYKEKFNNAVKEKEYFIENIFVNLFFALGYPFSNKYSLKECLIIFILNYVIYKGALTVYFSDKDIIEKDELIKITTIISRMYMYQNNDDLLKEFKKQKLDTLAHLINLIQNS